MTAQGGKATLKEYYANGPENAIIEAMQSAHRKPVERFELEDICTGEWLDWYALTPQQRWSESQKLWNTYLALGGTLDPEPDTQSPFYDAEASGEGVADGRSGLRVVRRGGV